MSYKSIMLELRYEYGTGLLNTSDVSGPRSTIQALVGIYMNR